MGGSYYVGIINVFPIDPQKFYAEAARGTKTTFIFSQTFLGAFESSSSTD